MSKHRIEALQDAYRYTVDHSAQAIDKFPADKRFYQVKPGKGHALWQVGHMALSLDLITNVWLMNGKSQLPAEWAPLFSPDVMGGKDPSSDPKTYPSWDEVVAAYKKVGAETIRLIGTLNDEQLAGDPIGPLPPPAKSFFGKLGVSLLAMSMHDSHHEGQLAMLKGAAS